MALELKLENGPTITLGEFPSGTVPLNSWMGTKQMDNSASTWTQSSIATTSLGTNWKAIASQLTADTLYKIKKAGVMRTGDHTYRLYPYHDKPYYITFYGRVTESYLSDLFLVVEIDSGTKVKGGAWRSRDQYADTAWGYFGLRPWTTADQNWWKSELGDTLYPRDALSLFISNALGVQWPGDPSTTGGGTGNFDLSSDPIDFPALPATGAVNSKFVTLYNPTETELNQIQSYLWTTDMGQAWEAIFKFIQDPMDMVIGLNMFPFTIPSTLLTSNKEPVEAGIIDVMIDPLTKVTSYKLLSQYIELDCGSIDVGQFYGTALDFQPYTKATIHVPFCGDYPLNIDDIRSNLDASVNGKTLRLKYHVDMFSGACVAMLKVGDAVLYQWSGSMAMNVPLTGSDYSNTIQNVISTATTIGMAASGAGAAAGAAKGAAGTSKAAAKEASAAAAKDSAIADLMSASSTMASSLKPQIQRAGSVAGSAGFLGVQSPYIVFEIPRQSIAEDYSKFMGFPCNVSYTLSSLVGKGFTVVSNMHLENITTNTAAIKSGATDNELGEIEKLLSGGVIL